MDREKVIRGLRDIDMFIAGRFGYEKAKNFLRTIDETIVLLKEQEDDYKNILSDYEDLAREHEKLLDKKIPPITNGQEVVRCKDCKHFAETQTGSPREEKRRYVCDEFNPPDDWFCADGERSEGR